MQGGGLPLPGTELPLSLTALRAGKQLLDEGGAAAELALLAKKAAIDAIEAEAALRRGADEVRELYEEAARLCDTAAGASPSSGRGLDAFARGYSARAAVCRDIASQLGRDTPAQPPMTSEEWHALQVVMPVRHAKAQWGLRPPVGAVDDAPSTVSTKAQVGGQVFRHLLCGFGAKSKVATPEEVHNPEHQLSLSGQEDLVAVPRVQSMPWPLADDEWDYLAFPVLFTRSISAATVGASAKHLGGVPRGLSIPRHLSLVEAAAALPAAEAPAVAPMGRCTLRKATMASLLSILESNEEPGFLERFYREYSRAHEFVTSKWSAEPRMPGTTVRGLRYIMPLPKDVPSAVARLVSIPDSSRVTTVLRLNAGAGGSPEVVLLLQTVAHDAPFSENFRTQETLCFSSDAGGGVSLVKWGEVVWVRPLPWTMGVVAKIIESKAMEGMRQALDILATVLEDMASHSNLTGL